METIIHKQHITFTKKYERQFAQALYSELTTSIKNAFSDNNPRYIFYGDIFSKLSDILSIKNKKTLDIDKLFPEYLMQFYFEVSSKATLYSLLSDEKSRLLLVKLSAYEILGHLRVKFFEEISIYKKFFEKKRNNNNNNNNKLSIYSEKYMNIFPMEYHILNINYKKIKLFSLYSDFLYIYYNKNSLNKNINAKNSIIIEIGDTRGALTVYDASNIENNSTVISIINKKYQNFILKQNLYYNKKETNKIYITDKFDIFISDFISKSRISGIRVYSLNEYFYLFERYADFLTIDCPWIDICLADKKDYNYIPKLINNYLESYSISMNHYAIDSSYAVLHAIPKCAPNKIIHPFL